MNVGIIGFGGAGIAHFLNFRCVPGCNVTKVFDIATSGIERAHRIAKGTTVCSSLNEFWEGLDAVTVCSPDSTHAEYIVEALARGLHVICEKPLTDTFEGLRQINAAHKKSHSVLAVLHQMRFVPLFQKIKSFIDGQALGTIGYLEGYYIHDLRERAFSFDNWRRTDCATPLIYAGCHFVDLLRWFTGDEIVEVYAAANHLSFPGYPESDLNLVTLKFRSGIIGKVVVAFGAAGPQDHSVRVYGTEKSIENNTIFNRDRSWGGLLHSPQIIQRELMARSGLSPSREVARQLRANLPAYAIDRIFRMMRPLSRHPNNEYGCRYYPLRLYEHSLACVGAIADFARAVRESGQPLCSFEEAAKTVVACIAGVESYRTNNTVTVPVLDDILN
jgi:predicted dehydrogenase